jgi:hypothetical protein
MGEEPTAWHADQDLIRAVHRWAGEPVVRTKTRAIAEALNARGIRTARGGEWHYSTVRNLPARA